MVQFTKLRLSGFKSFVDPTEIPVEPGLTGIVGPNGCGKSNLVEALRWAMGESSAKRMRGSEMDDVIFAGSASRPSRNIAEVALFLDNSDRSAPAQFNDSEDIEVTRRIERGSGSTYRVSGQEVRARDVQLLFADSATGAHSTALVGQGRIGALINAKPTDRRALLEEAGGISGLHSRRHEAELRLRAAESNLERLDDVIATLESQLQGLKRQARQASRYRNLAGHIRRHEAILLHLEAEAARGQLAAAENQLQTAEASVVALTQSAAAHAAAQGEAAARLPELRQSEAEGAAALQRLLVERDNLDREEARAVAARMQTEQRLGQIEADLARARALAEDAEGAQQRLGAERQELDRVSASEGEAIAAAMEQQGAAVEALAERETALDQRAGAVAAGEARRSAIEQRLEELSQRLERLRGQGADLTRERDDLTREQENSSALANAKERLSESESQLQHARAAAESAEAHLTLCRDREQAARDNAQRSDAVKTRFEAEIAALAALLEPMESSIWPPVIDALNVDSGYETALGVALGDDLNASADEGAPIHWEVLPAYPKTSELPSGIAPLSRFVRGPAALTRRLSQIGVVADAPSGKRLQSELQPGQRLVSREGDLWRWDGFSVAAGAPTAAAQRLEQRNRLVEVRKALSEAGPRSRELREAHDQAKSAAEESHRSVRAARESLSEAFNQAKAARDGHGEVAEKAAATSSRLAAIEVSAKALASEIDEGERLLAAARDENANLPDLSAAREQATALREDVIEHRRALSEWQGRVERLAREAEVRAQRLAAIEEEKASWSRRAEDARGHSGELEQRQSEAQKEIEQLLALPADIGQRRHALADQIDAAEQRRKQAADSLALGETRLADCDRALKSEEAKLAETREDRVRAEAAVAQAEQTLAQIDQRAQERLECGLDGILEAVDAKLGDALPEREQIEVKLARLVRERENLGAVNLRAEQEARDLEQQIEGMSNERGDLIAAIGRLRQGISSLNREGRERLLAAFETVNKHFSELFVRLFGGGRAHLKLIESDDPLEAGLEIMASPPGKRLQTMSLLSGGEQAMTAVALLFAVFMTNPAPICVLDEVDAPLDDANVDRFCTLVEELARRTETRFLIITHHRMTMARVDRLFGVTMAERGVSQLVSVDLEAAESLRETA